jgi:hypothetical protein
MLKIFSVMMGLTVITACTPIPERLAIRQTPRPVAPLPVETMQPKAQPSPTASSAAKPKGAAKAKPAALSANEVKVRLQQAEDKAMSAASLQQSAQTKEDWSLVINQWRQAIKILTQIPANSPQKAIVQQQLADYQSKLAQAQRSASSPSSAIPVQTAPRKDGVPMIIIPGGDPSPSPSPTTSPTPAPDGQATPASSPPPPK